MQATVFETYLQHANPDVFPAFRKNLLLIDLGRIISKINQFHETAGFNHLELIEEISNIFETMPDLDFFEQLDKTCKDAVFFETLISNIKNVILSEQHKIFIDKNRKYDRIKKLLVELKKNYVKNCVRIFELEGELTNLLELDLKDELENMRVFDRLNNEKITPYFMSLAKSAQKNDNLDVICDDNGHEFSDSETRNKHITDTFEKLYKNPNPEKNITVEDIGAFLGDSLEASEVENAKLNEFEKKPIRTRFAYCRTRSINQSSQFKKCSGA
jgi:hypothetical protein